MPIITDEHGWILESAHNAYAVGINGRGQLVLRYWGVKLPFVSDYPKPTDYGDWASFNGAGQRNPEEFPTYGADFKFIEPCLKATFSDGVRDVWLTFQKAIRIDDANAITIRMDDAHYPLRVYITYKVHEETDLIERYVEVQNHGDEPIVLERILSGSWHLPLGGQYDLLHYVGRWNDEWQLKRQVLPHGITKLDSKRGTSSHHHHPAVILARPDTHDTSGECWAALLEYSGNWQFLAEVTDFATMRFSMGLNDWDFAYRLDPTLTYQTPSVFLNYSHDGLQSLSHRLHEFIRARVPHPDYTRKVLYNSWEATLFDVDEASQKAYAETAADLGVELFVMDDGWFHGRNSDRAGLGDWFPDAIKFPNGLDPLIQHVNSLGIDFGLWVEPEMVNADSDLYRAHPEWVIHFPTRPRTEARNQMILNLSRKDVQDYLIEVLTDLLRAHNIAFIKWDMNRNVSEAGWDTERDPKEIWVRYVEGLYRVWGLLQERFPSIIWQSCSGGGGRADLGILQFADQVWLSDNTEPTRRIPMQNAYLHIYPPNTLEAWVTDMGAVPLPLSFRFHVSMCGNLGIGANITHWNDEQKAIARKLVAQYKDIRHIIQQGTVYRHDPNPQGGYHALQFVSQDRRESALFVFRVHSPDPTHPYIVRLRGLDDTVRYAMPPFGRKSGAGWMNTDLQLDMQPFESQLFILRAE